jgi:hypothetical protein
VTCGLQATNLSFQAPCILPASIGYSSSEPCTAREVLLFTLLPIGDDAAYCSLQVLPLTRGDFFKRAASDRYWHGMAKSHVSRQGISRHSFSTSPVYCLSSVRVVFLHGSNGESSVPLSNASVGFKYIEPHRSPRRDGVKTRKIHTPATAEESLKDMYISMLSISILISIY